MFSIIIPVRLTLDRIPMIRELFSSIPDRKDVEVIVVDDNSPEDIPHPGFVNARFILECSPGRFAGSARNHGLSIASGAAVLFADSDDKFDKHWLNKVFDTLAASFDEWDMALFRLGSFVDGTGEEGSRHTYLNQVWDMCRSGEHPLPVRFITPVGRVIKKEFLLENGIDFGSTRVANDVLFSVKVGLAHPRVKFLDGIGYHIRQDHASLVSRGNLEATIERIVVMGQANRLLDKAGVEWTRFVSDTILFSQLSHRPDLMMRAWLWTRTKPGVEYSSLFGLMGKVSKKMGHFRSRNNGVTR